MPYCNLDCQRQAALPWIVVGDNTGIFHNRGREVRCLWEESTSLGSKGNVISERREQENTMKEKRKMVIAVNRNNSFHSHRVFRPCDLRVS